MTEHLDPYPGIACAWERPGCLNPASKAPAGAGHGLCESCLASLSAESRLPVEAGDAPPINPPSSSPSAAAATALSVLPGGGGPRDSFVVVQRDDAGRARRVELEFRVRVEAIRNGADNLHLQRVVCSDGTWDLLQYLPPGQVDTFRRRARIAFDLEDDREGTAASEGRHVGRL